MKRGSAIALGLAAAVAAHPLHTSLTELSYRGRAIRVSVRVFADDFRAALRRDVSDSSAATYLRAALRLTDRSGRRLRLDWCGMRRTGDLLWLCLEAATGDGIPGLEIRDAIHWELFADQLNIVQVDLGGRRATLVFSKDDGPQRIR